MHWRALLDCLMSVIHQHLHETVLGQVSEQLRKSLVAELNGENFRNAKAAHVSLKPYAKYPRCHLIHIGTLTSKFKKYFFQCTLMTIVTQHMGHKENVYKVMPTKKLHKIRFFFKKEIMIRTGMLENTLQWEQAGGR